jgi:predicted MFS family arabinose efflux permease
VFWLLAAFTLLPYPLVLRVKEGERPVERSFDWGAFSAFRQPVVLALSALGFVFFFIIAGTNQLVNPFLEGEYGITLTTAGLLTTVWGLGVVLGSVVGGRLIDRVGDRRATWLSLSIALVGTLALAVVPNQAMAWPIVALFGLAYGTYQTVYFALAMAHTDPRIAASMFSILMAVTNVAQGAGMAASGVLADRVGFRWTFAAIAALNLLAVPLMPLVFARPKLARAQA